MASGERVKDSLSRRRRNRAESDEEESVAGTGDSQSEASIASDADDGGEISEEDDVADHGRTEPMDHSEQPKSETSGSQSQSKPKARSRRAKGSRKAKDTSIEQDTSRGQEPTFQETADTDIMNHGLKVPAETAAGETLEFGQMTAGQDRSAPRRGENNGDKRGHEQEDYKKKRDADPTFIPNRGNFFMHDARIPEQRGFGPQGRGRGRGRGAIGGPYSPATYVYLLARLVCLQPADIY